MNNRERVPVRVVVANPVQVRVWSLIGRIGLRRVFRVYGILLGCDIPCRDWDATGIKMPHPYGIVIHQDSSIGANVTIYQNVTVGVSRAQQRPPKIGDNVLIGANAVVIGDIQIGDGAVIGAGAVVLSSVAPGVTVVGNPARPVGSKAR